MSNNNSTTGGGTTGGGGGGGGKMSGSSGVFQPGQFFSFQQQQQREQQQREQQQQRVDQPTSLVMINQPLYRNQSPGIGNTGGGGGYNTLYSPQHHHLLQQQQQLHHDLSSSSSSTASTSSFYNNSNVNGSSGGNTQSPPPHGIMAGGHPSIHMQRLQTQLPPSMMVHPHHANYSPHHHPSPPPGVMYGQQPSQYIGDDNVYYDMGGNDNTTWFELRMEPEYPTPASGIPTLPTVLRFDPWMELLWVGYGNGHVSSLMSPSLERYSSFQAIPQSNVSQNSAFHPQQQQQQHEIRDMLIDYEGVVSVASNHVAFHSRGGAPIFALKSDRMRDLNAVSYSKFDNSEFVVSSSHTASLFVVDFYTGRMVREVPMPSHVKTINRSSRGVWCGQSNGDISMLDPRTWRIEHSLSAHKAEVLSSDIKNDILVSCGCSPRNGQIFTDPVVKVFDIKTLRSLPPIQYKRPAMVKFHPKYYSSIAIIPETSNQLQITDINVDGTTPVNIQQNVILDNIYGYVLSFDFSSSGEIMAFGDSSSIIHQWVEKENFRVNASSYPIDFGQYPQFTKPKRMDDDYPLSAVPFIMDQDTLNSNGISSDESYVLDSSNNTQLLSYWKPSLSYPVGMPTRPLNPSLLAHLKQHDFVGYITNTGISRKQFRGKSYEDGKSQKTLANIALSSISHVRPPKSYRWMEISFTKLGVEEFDVSFHNKTKFSGLENSLFNTYSNCCIQTLYFIPHIRNSLLNHLCSKNYCLSCELGFIFHMMEQSKGRTIVETSNFLRVLKQFPQAEALGLCLSHEQPESPLPLHQLITNFNRFLIEQIHKDLMIDPPIQQTITHHHGVNKKQLQQLQLQQLQQQQQQGIAGESIIDTLFGSTVFSSNKCINCGHQYEKTSRHFQFDIQYPNSVQELGPDGATFANLLKTTLCKQIKTPAWCEKCQNYFATIQNKQPKTLPNILCLNANISKKEYEDYWKYTPNNTITIGGTKSFTSSTPLSNPAQQQPTADDAFDNETTWLPLKIRLKIDSQTDQFSVIEYKNNIINYNNQNNNNNNNCTDSTTTSPSTNTNTTTTPDFDTIETEDGQLYELVSMISHIRDQVKRLPKQGHLVAQCRVTDFYQQPPNTTTTTTPTPTFSPYYLFNDFKVKPCTLNDVCHFDGNWKTAAILFYRRVGYDQPNTSKTKPYYTLVDPIPKLVNPITKDVYLANNIIVNKNNQTFVPPTAKTIPKADDLVAIDTEFVSIGPSETEISSDGKRVIIQPGNFSLARASLVRANGESFLDDYIQSIEPVTDYLTRFSGIQLGDLDPKVSTKNLVSLKSCYLKLRYLVDQKVIFVGHGLKKDFRIINMFVPPEQIVDTVELFQLRNQRKLSLRFLAYILLNIDIQSETHCSIEDAKTAMELYQQYQQLVKNKEFEETLNKIYQIGRKLNFKVPENLPANSGIQPAPAGLVGSAMVDYHNQSFENYIPVSNTNTFGSGNSSATSSPFTPHYKS